MALVDDETKYFWYHHTDGDTMDKLDPRELSACAAAMAVMAWQVAEAPVALPRAENGPAEKEYLVNPEPLLAGILEPVFAIRTEYDLGAGDTESVRQMIDWCIRHRLN